MNIKVIRCHEVYVGYEDSNPFSLCDWVLEVGKAGYTHIVEGEFDRFFVREEDVDKIPKGGLFAGNNLISVSDYKEEYTIETLEEMDLDTEYLSQYEQVIILAPINPMTELGDGDIHVTTVESA